MANKKVDPSKRKFLANVTATVGGAGAAGLGYVFVASMLPTKEVAAQGIMEVDLSGIPEGEFRTVLWRGKPVFLMHRSEQQIQAMRASQGVKAPQADQERVINPRWLILVGVCTHLGCVPNGTPSGWICPCHGSEYDFSGRVLSGPAPGNLQVPPYKFINDTKIVLGQA